MNDRERYAIDTYISSPEETIKSDQEETVGTALSLVTSSHTPVFIFSGSDSFVGIISPFQVLYEKRYPYTTKVRSIAMTPPQITKQTPLYIVASHMLSLRLYTLPVFSDEGKIEGIIQAKNIFRGIIGDEDFLRYTSAFVTPANPITAHLNSTVGDVYQIMREKRISRVILIDDEGDVTGIVSRKDLIPGLVKPTPKQRFGKNGFSPTDWAFDEEKKLRQENPIRIFATKQVNTMPAETPTEIIVKNLIDSERNSIVLVNRHHEPVGFLSLHDILSAVKTLEPEDDVNLIINNPSNSVTDGEMKQAHEHLVRFSNKLKKRIAVKKIEVDFEEPKYPSGETVEFNTTIIATPIAGSSYRVKVKRKVFLDSIQAATEQIEKQEQRSNVSKLESMYTTS